MPPRNLTPHALVRGLSLRDGLRAWARGAGINGAYVPEALARRAGCSQDLAQILRLATNDATWRSVIEVVERGEGRDQWIPPALPVLDDHGLHWETTVTLSLVELEDGWAVTLDAPHPAREAAVLATTAAPTDDRW